MAVSTKLNIGALLTLKDGSTLEVFENDELSGVVYEDKEGRHTIDGRLRVIVATSKMYSKGPTTCPPEPFADTLIGVDSIIVDISDKWDAKLVTIPMKDLITIGSAGSTTPEPSTDKYVDPADPALPGISEVLSTIEDGATVTIGAGEISDPITIDKSVAIKGVNAGVSQNFDQTKKLP